ncbi:hypothetical protein XSR1_350018 [Xenorhabdus szentirmaii DSM 16338]|uniref:Uncharacterized protein n=1 Tax=Xenorhabdus szentirmaii DSM 16338 TaxID=1427518 RepID=W1J1C6_9GAMM|nr:hypothetical protein XSR1_350018 [Xenorhabdus szentirmaii DSM 16338]
MAYNILRLNIYIDIYQSNGNLNTIKNVREIIYTSDCILFFSLILQL